MELLIRVAETGSMTLTARQMGLTPAAVSAAVGRAEETIGVRLFERTTRSVHPTEEGLALVEGCAETVERWRRTLDEVQGTAQELEGTIHVSAPADTTYQILASVVVALAEQHPKLQLVLHTSDAVQHLHKDAIDMAIRYGALPDSSLSARKLADGPGVLVAAPSYLTRWGAPEDLEALGAHRLLALQRASTPVHEWTLRSLDEERVVAFRSALCGNGYLVRGWAIAGMGIAMKSLIDVIEDLEEGRLVRVLPRYQTPPIPIHAVFPSRRFLPARVRALDAAVSAQIDVRAARCERWLRGPSPRFD